MTALRTVAQDYLRAVGKEREAAVLLLARLLTRPDVVAAHLPVFLDWAASAVGERNSVVTAGVLATVAAVLKHAPRRADVAPFLTHVARLADHPSVTALLATNSLVRKLRIKVSPMTEPSFACGTLMARSLLDRSVPQVLQRLGLAYLPPRLAAWRYQLGTAPPVSPKSTRCAQTTMYVGRAQAGARCAA